MAPRPPQWSVNATAKRIEFDDGKYSTAAFKNYRDEDLEKVFNAMVGNTYIETIAVTISKVGDEASRSIREALSENVNVVEVSFTNCVLAPKRLKRILQGLVYNKDEGDVSNLSFVDCALDDRAARHFDELWVSPPPDNTMLMRRLTTLNLERNKLGDKGAIAVSYLLSPSSNLTKLLLARNKISDRGASAIAEKLKKNRILHTLTLGYNLIGPDGGVNIAKALEGNKHLVALELPGNRIGAAGATEFARVLDKNVIGKSALSTLDISCNNIGDVGGAKMQELADQQIVGNIILTGNQVGVCSCKHCVLTPNADPSHWCYEVGKFEVEVLDIDDNGGLLTTANNATEFERDGDKAGLKRGGARKLVPRLVKDTGPKKIGFKAPRQNIDKNGKRLRRPVIFKSTNMFEDQLNNIMGNIGGVVSGKTGEGEGTEKDVSEKKEDKEQEEGDGEEESGNDGGEGDEIEEEPILFSQSRGMLMSASTPNLNINSSRLSKSRESTRKSARGGPESSRKESRRNSKALAELNANSRPKSSEGMATASAITTVPAPPIRKQNQAPSLPKEGTLHKFSVSEMLAMSREANQVHKMMSEDVSLMNAMK